MTRRAPVGIAEPHVRVARERTGEERRSADALDLLSRRLDRVCTGAVDSLEIAAALEADGLNDTLVRERFGMPDVFSVAEELHKRVPLRPRTNPPDEQTSTAFACLGRGALFALPAVYFLAIQGAVSSRIATIVLISVTIAGWAASQAISVTAYGVLGRRGPAAARGLLRVNLIAALVAATLVGAAGTTVLGWQPTLTVVASALALYIVAATVLVFVEADLVLACTLAPGALAAAVHATLAPLWLDADLLLAIMSASVVLVLIGAFMRTAGGVRAGVVPDATEVKRALPYVTYGALAGSLVAAPLMGSLVIGGRAPALLALGMLPLTLSMGVAEFELRRHLGATRAALAREYVIAGFLRRALRSLMVSAGRYATALIAISGVMLAAVALSGRSSAALAPLLAAYLMLGIGLFLGLVVAATGNVARVAWVLASAVTLYGALRAGTSVEPTPAFVVVCAAVLGGSAWLAWRDVRNVVNHR
jgi:hypothetical protein